MTLASGLIGCLLFQRATVNERNEHVVEVRKVRVDAFTPSQYFLVTSGEMQQQIEFHPKDCCSPMYLHEGKRCRKHPNSVSILSTDGYIYSTKWKSIVRRSTKLQIDCICT